jgi:hypothetical protein
MQLVAGLPVGIESVVDVAGGVVVETGLQELLDVGCPGLWPDRDPPPPVGGRLAVGIGELGRAGASLQRRRSPPVHEQPWRAGLPVSVGGCDRGD